MYRILVSLCLIALHMGSNSVGASPVDGEETFNPDNVVIYEMPATCPDKNYCFDKDDKYPQTTIDELLEKMPLPKSIGSRIARSISFREGDEVPGNPDCPANTTYIDKPIYYIVDENHQHRVVIQSPKFQQIYSVKFCQHEGRITEDTDHFLKRFLTLEKYKIECVNTYMDVDFFVLKDNEGQEMEIARPKGGIPVCCRCRYYKVKA